MLKNRSSHQRCSMKKGVLRNFTKFTGKQLCQSLFFNKVAGLRLQVALSSVIKCVVLKNEKRITKEMRGT